MGQKVHPHGFRLGYSKTWRSRWFADSAYRDSLHEDLKLRRLLKRRLYHAGISRVEIERPGNKLNIYIHTSTAGNHHRAKGDGGGEADARPPQAHRQGSPHSALSR